MVCIIEFGSTLTQNLVTIVYLTSCPFYIKYTNKHHVGALHGVLVILGVAGIAAIALSHFAGTSLPKFLRSNPIQAACVDAKPLPFPSIQGDKIVNSTINSLPGVALLAGVKR